MLLLLISYIPSHYGTVSHQLTILLKFSQNYCYRPFKYKKHLKNVGPFATTSRLTPIHQMSLAVLSRAACASMSTTTTSGSAIAEGPREALVSRNPATTKHHLKTLSCGIICVILRLAVLILYQNVTCLLYTSPSPRDRQKSRMPSSA